MGKRTLEAAVSGSEELRTLLCVEDICHLQVVHLDMPILSIYWTLEACQG